MKPRRVGLVAIGVALLVAVAFVVISRRDPPPSPSKSVPTKWEAARVSPMHTVHVGTKKIACDACHEDGFATPPSEKTCAKSDCHAGAAKNAHVGDAGAPTPCLSCHVFAGAATASACTDCHAGQRAPALATHKAVACASCHALHGDAGARALLGDCSACHLGGAAHGRALAQAPDAGAVDAGLADPKMARATAPVSAALFAPGAHVAPGKTSGAVCSTCHAPHQGKEAARATCAGCHVAASRIAEGARLGARPEILFGSGLAELARAAPAVSPRGARVAGHEACVTCHVPHDATRAAVKSCVGCHGGNAGAAGVPAHAACVTCHAPHAPGEASSACARCHAGKTTLSSATVPAHDACRSCHDPHRPDRAPAAACAGCHGGVKPSHPGAPAAGQKLASSVGAACVGCHRPHGGPSKAASCSSCHTKAKSGQTFHAKSTACNACHAPHAFRLAGAGAALCAKCHAAEVKATGTRAGHAKCAECHGAPHAPTAKPVCSTCHAAEARSAPRGHAKCGSCHDAHSGSLGTHVNCTSCHTDKSKAQHASLPGGCATCHRPHGPKGVASPPPCASCHAPAKLPGLHGVGGHARCATCHTGHGSPRSDRATCTGTCHADRKTHQPAAAVCKGCHIFRN